MTLRRYSAIVGAVILASVAGCGKKAPPVAIVQEEPPPSPRTNSSAGPLTVLSARPGSRMRIEGTSTVHKWQVEGRVIGGFLEVGSNFPTEPGQDVKPGKVDARAEVFITVRSLQSVEKNGAHFSDKMDETMWNNLKVNEQPRISYRSTALVLKDAAKSSESPYVFDSKGELVVAGVTNQVSMPVHVLPLGDKSLKITGSLPTRMSNFNIPVEKIGLGFVSFKTGDDVNLIFEWMVGPAKAPAAPAPPK